jgi:hypothetical protein
MSHPWQRYLTELWQKWRLLAAWEPTTPISLGDVGVMEQGVWRRLTNVGKQGIAFESRRGDALSSRSYSSSGDVKIAVKAGAGAVGVPVKGEVGISFGSSGAVLFNATGCREARIADVGSLELELWRRFENGEWDPRHVVVTKVLEVERAVILIASGKESEVGFSVEAKAGLAVADLNLANASLSPRITHSKGLTGRYLAESLTPLFEAVCIDRKGLLRRRQIGGATPAGGRLTESDADSSEMPEGGRVIPYRYEYEEFLGDEG